MNPHVEILQDEFTDYAGKKHIFMVAAVSEHLEDDSLGVVEVQGLEAEVIDDVKETVGIGISLCNPCDTFNERAGAMKAIHRAENVPTFTYTCSTRGGFDADVVKALMTRAAKYVKQNRDEFIPGYSEMKERYLKNKQMEDFGKGLGEVERIVVEKTQEDPRFLTKIQEYIDWSRNQKKGKCQKRGE